MKITKNMLKQLIKEELNLEEGPVALDLARKSAEPQWDPEVSPPGVRSLPENWSLIKGALGLEALEAQLARIEARLDKLEQGN